MCGIAGIIAPHAERYREPLRRMLASIRHRGPDDDGAHFFDHCALGHTRLSIIDPAGGHQPMVTSGGRVGITFNGEIYGYQLLRQNLSEYPFRTECDTEVVLALYQQHGATVPEHLPGMFAFGIWDETSQTLFCARDRFGEKPFFYACGRDGEFIFASEIKAILSAGLLDPQLDRGAVREYLRLGYVGPGRTIYRNIHALPPAHRLTYREGTADVRRYWDLPPEQEGISMEDAVEEFRHLFDQAVARQLVADVPVGAFLSGGLDSSTIVAVASRHHQGVKTFSFGFGEAIDETSYAREIAERYQTDHHELTDNAHDIAVLLRRMQQVYDEPFGDSSNIPTYLLSGLARKHVTVALAGEGADELLAGYDFWYRPLLNLERAQCLPDITATLLRIAALGCKMMGRPLPSSMAALREGYFIKEHHADCLSAHRQRSSYFTSRELDALGLPSCDAAASGAGGLNGVLASDIRGYLPGDILTKTDRASMAWGLEIRCPFLDVDLASFCIGLPLRLKIDTRRDKILLREAYGDAWTPRIRARTKQGFGGTVQAWLKQPPVAEMKASILGNPRHPLAGLLDPRAASAYSAADNQQTWLLLVLGAWLEEHPV
jgi:asparagine synthase (glutamine-hydrolysing)